MPKAKPLEVHEIRFKRWMRGYWLSSIWAVNCCMTVSCPKCKAAKTWPCFSLTAGIETSTPHAARWEAYNEAKAEQGSGAGSPDAAG